MFNKLHTTFFYSLAKISNAKQYSEKFVTKRNYSSATKSVIPCVLLRVRTTSSGKKRKIAVDYRAMILHTVTVTCDDQRTPPPEVIGNFRSFITGGKMVRDGGALNELSTFFRVFFYFWECVYFYDVLKQKFAQRAMKSTGKNLSCFICEPKLI